MSSTATIRVLLADESDADRLLAATLLGQSLGLRFQITECTHFDVAEQAILGGRDRFDAVLLGLRPEGGNEIRRLRHITAALGPQPLILCHEFLDISSVDELAAAGVQAILPKSQWSAETLAHTIAFAIGQVRRVRAFGHDILTGLPSRTVWLDRISHALERCRRSSTPFAVMLIDVDDFKQVNDSLGHEAGDRLLREISQRLRNAVRQNDTVARLGGDEFALLVEDLPYPEAALRVARKVIADVCTPATLSRATVPVSISVGVAILSPHQRQLTSDWAHQAADTALYEAKRLGKSRFNVFTEDMDRALRDSLQLDDELARAVQRDEFALNYQPVVSLQSGALVGFEALLRWTHGPRQGVSPATFVPVLERLGLMDRVGLAIFDEALAQLGRWRRSTGTELFMHVNLSASQLVDRDFSGAVMRAIERAEVPGEALVIELTETVLFKYGEVLSREFARLRRYGVRFAIDDFGTGYNSFLYLKQFQPDVVKIDRAFVRQVVESPVDAAVVRALSVLARALGISLVAEGVETEQQLLALQRAGDSDLIQGYLTGRPMSPDEVERGYRAFKLRVDGNGGGGPPVRRPSGERAAAAGRLRTSTEPGT